jgi:predicted PurR-regulated permease PerM
MPAAPAPRDPHFTYPQRVLIAVLITILILLVLLLLWYALYVLLLIFAGILFAILLRTAADAIHHQTRIPKGWSLLLTVLLLAGLIFAISWFAAARIASQVDALRQQLPEAWNQLKTQASHYHWGQLLLNETPSAQDLVATTQPDLLKRAGGVLTTTLNLIVATAVILAVGLYFAADPDLYRRGVLHLVPKPYRPRAAEIFDAVGETLRWWLLGQCVSMAFVGVAISLGLWMLNVPLALTLGLLAGLLNFVPNLGAILAAAPAVLLAFTQSPSRALGVIVLTTVVQSIEGYALTPMVQKRAVNLPPALTITAQILIASLAGPLGLLLATPLIAAALVIIQRLYVEETLGDDLPPDPKPCP